MVRREVLPVVLGLMIVFVIAAWWANPLSVGEARSPKTICLGNVKQLGTCLAIYQADFDNRFCLSDWTEATSAYSKNPSLYQCPSLDPDSKRPPTPGGYAMNYLVLGKIAAKLNPKTPVLFDTDAIGRDVVTSVNARSARHRGGANVGFADTSAKFVKAGTPLREGP